MKKITAVSLADEAAAQIRHEIATGQFAPGQQLRESQLARALGVSRGPVREAFKLLKAEGLVYEEPNRGTFVVSLSPADVGEIFEVRMAVEARSVKLITRAQEPRVLDTIREHAERLIAAAASGDDSSVAQSDVDFHAAICKGSGVGRLHQIFLQNCVLLRALLLVDEYLYPVVADSSDEHADIVRAIETGDEAVAVATLESHLERSRDRLVRYLEDQALASARRDR